MVLFETFKHINREICPFVDLKDNDLIDGVWFLWIKPIIPMTCILSQTHLMDKYNENKAGVKSL